MILQYYTMRFFFFQKELRTFLLLVVHSGELYLGRKKRDDLKKNSLQKVHLYSEKAKKFEGIPMFCVFFWKPQF